MEHHELRANTDTYYSIAKSDVTIDEPNGKITATLSLASPSDGTTAQTLTLTLTFYQNGILRMLIEDDTGRFRISQEELMPVVDSQLTA